MSDIFLGTKNTSSTQGQGLGTNQKYVWGQGSNDVFIGTDGDLISISGTNKLQQDITKSLMTDRFKNIIYPLYGSTVRNDILGQKMGLQFIKAKAKNAVIEALAVLQFLNSDNTNLDEQISNIDRVSVNTNDPREVEIQVQVTTKAGTVVSTTVLFE
jgi:hypothetical protein